MLTAVRKSDLSLAASGSGIVAPYCLGGNISVKWEGSSSTTDKICAEYSD
jgi:hypothetical protein